MTHSRSRRRRAHRLLQSETPSTVAVLTTEREFAAMRRYRTFVFDDYPAYLRHVQRLLRSLDARGVHARVAAFDPAGYALFCHRGGLEPDASPSRTRYTAEVAGSGRTVPYRGQSCGELLSSLRAPERGGRPPDRGLRRGARTTDTPSATSVVPDRAFRAATDAFDALLTALGPGRHHLVCSVDAPESPLLAVLEVRTTREGRRELDGPDTTFFCAVLAVGLAHEASGGLVTRTAPSVSGRGRVPETVRGWCLQGGWLAPLAEAEVFSAYCTHAETGEPLPPEPGVRYGAGIPLPRAPRA
ncbi:hypothetical protein [Streptomyces sp. TR02-1]|uniref:hypothetical protein n=1 Tax=Streptomyces sp. TR02-1 TaxID=3385977 RepID=UPI0039A1FDD3